LPYSPKCVEYAFCELRLSGVLGSWPPSIMRSPAPIACAAATTEGVDYSSGLGLRGSGLYNGRIVGRAVLGHHPPTRPSLCAHPLRCAAHRLLSGGRGSHHSHCAGLRPLVVDRNIRHFLWYGAVAGDGLRSVGEEALPHPRACALSCPSPFAGRSSHTSQGMGLRPFALRFS
jgi:hypothetical protein